MFPVGLEWNTGHSKRDAGVDSNKEADKEHHIDYSFLPSLVRWKQS